MVLALTMMNDNDIASKFKANVRIRPNKKDPLFGTGPGLSEIKPT